MFFAPTVVFFYYLTPPCWTANSSDRGVLFPSLLLRVLAQSWCSPNVGKQNPRSSTWSIYYPTRKTRHNTHVHERSQEILNEDVIIENNLFKKQENKVKTITEEDKQAILKAKCAQPRKELDHKPITYWDQLLFFFNDKNKMPSEDKQVYATKPLSFWDVETRNGLQESSDPVVLDLKGGDTPWGQSSLPQYLMISKEDSKQRYKSHRGRAQWKEL